MKILCYIWNNKGRVSLCTPYKSQYLKGAWDAPYRSEEKMFQKTRKWTKTEGKDADNCTLQTFIRNHIHHPENQTMQSSLYTKEELEQSIEEMINLLEQTRPN